MKRHVAIALLAAILSACAALPPAPQWQLDLAQFASERC